MRINDANKYQMEQQHSKVEKANRQKQLREFLEMQVTSKHHSLQTMVSTEKQQEYQQILKRVQEMKHREDMQRQIRKETL
jgi:hypothetical protein